MGSLMCYYLCPRETSGKASVQRGSSGPFIGGSIVRCMLGEHIHVDFVQQGHMLGQLPCPRAAVCLQRRNFASIPFVWNYLDAEAFMILRVVCCR